jgi:hypothetical protein
MNLYRLIKDIWNMPDLICELEEENRDLKLLLEALLRDKTGEPQPKGTRLTMHELHLN